MGSSGPREIEPTGSLLPTHEVRAGRTARPHHVVGRPDLRARGLGLSAGVLGLTWDSLGTQQGLRTPRNLRNRQVASSD